MSRLLLLLFAVVMAIAIIYNPEPQQQFPTYHVSRIIDGDTLIVDDDLTIRIRDIDAPEMHTRAGRNARTALVQLIGDNEIGLDCNGHDKYGRNLCLAYINGMNVGTSMLDIEGVREWK